jgi:large subunit ribosomal protein L10
MKQEKQFLLDELQGIVEENGSFLLVGYNQLNAELTHKFRRAIKKVGGTVQIARKRVLAKSVESMGIKLDLATLPGHIALIATGADPLTTTKTVFQFGKENDKVVDVKGGHLYGQLYSAEDVERLSQLPDIDGMRAQLLATLEAPLSHTISVMEAIMCSLMHCLENKVQKSQA